jgi:ubiquinol-cytochrome c reductase iron-sulfur subunit
MEKKRRDFLKLVTGAVTLTGGGFVTWSLIASLNPASDVLRPLDIDLSELKAGEENIVKLAGLPYVVRLHPADELSKLATVPAESLRDNLARNPNLSEGATATLRNRMIAFAPEFSIMIRLCLRESCPLLPDDGELLCPCCGTRFDMVGRVGKGIVSRNLPIPTYAKSGEAMLKLAIQQPPVHFGIAN